MNRLLPHIVSAALLLTGLAACDRGSNTNSNQSKADGTSAPPTAPVKSEETSSGAMDSTAMRSNGVSQPPAAAESADTTPDARRGALSGAGADVCGGWNLEGDTLVHCRKDWMDAQSDADRLRIRNTYEPRAGARAAQEIPVNRTPEELNSPTFCDQFKLRGADLSECRAQWKAAKTEGDVARIRDRYAALSPDAHRNNAPSTSR